MRVLDLQKLPGIITCCPFCKSELIKTPTLLFCIMKGDDNCNNINYLCEKNKIIGVHFSIPEQCDLKFNFENNTTNIYYNGRLAQIDKIIDFDLCKITLEGIRDILVFI